MSKYFVPDTTFGMDAECAVCCCLWTDPVEVNGCQHIFCRGCVEGLSTCPVCCGPVERLNTPGKFILRLLQRTQGSCSSCAWKGTYHDFKEKHVQCLAAGEQGPSSGEDSPTALECVTMQEYYLETHNGPTASPGVANAFPSRPAPAAADRTNASRPSNGATTSAAAAAAANTTKSAAGAQSVAASGGDVRMTAEQRAHWRLSLTSSARDYGMSEKEYRELVDRYPDFAVLTPNSHKTPELRWRDACRLLRFFNHPSHPDDVKNLFEMANRDPVTQSVPFNVLCLWLMMNRRNPAQWYHMTAGPYEQILQVAQLLDVEATGLFSLEQGRILAEQYFERDVGDAEWLRIEPLLRSKDAEIRQSFLGNASRRRRSEFGESVVRSTVKLPFHDILCAFTRHVDMLKKEQQQIESQRVQADYIRRIKRIVGHYEPDAVNHLEGTLQKFKGEEGSLLMTLTAMYGPEPA